MKRKATTYISVLALYLSLPISLCPSPFLHCVLPLFFLSPLCLPSFLIIPCATSFPLWHALFLLCALSLWYPYILTSFFSSPSFFPLFLLWIQSFFSLHSYAPSFDPTFLLPLHLCSTSLPYIISPLPSINGPSFCPSFGSPFLPCTNIYRVFIVILLFYILWWMHRLWFLESWLHPELKSCLSR